MKKKLIALIFLLPCMAQAGLEVNGDLRIMDSTDTYHIGFKAGALSASQIWTAPLADGAVGEFWITNGAGVFSFGDHGDVPGLTDDDHTAYVLDAGTPTDNTLIRADGTDGRTMQTSGIVVDDSDNMSGVDLLTMDEIEILLSTNQNWKFVKGSFERLALQAQAANTASFFTIHPKTGDEGDDTGLVIFARGQPIFDGDFSQVALFFDASENKYLLSTDKGGTGVDVDLEINSGGDLELDSSNNVVIHCVDDLELEPSSNVRSTNVRDDTTGSAANMYISASSGNMQRSTSSARFKTIDSDMTAEKAECVLNLRPRKFYSLCAKAVIELKKPIGDPNQIFFRKPYKDFTSFEDMIAEYGIKTDNIESMALEGDDPTKPFYGLVAEEVAEVYPEAVAYSTNSNGVQVAESYDMNFIVAALVKHIQEQDKRIKVLENLR